MYVFMYASECMSMEVESLSFLVSFATIVLYKTGGPSRIIHSVYAACVPAKPFADRLRDIQGGGLCTCLCLILRASKPAM